MCMYMHIHALLALNYMYLSLSLYVYEHTHTHVTFSATPLHFEALDSNPVGDALDDSFAGRSCSFCFCYLYSISFLSERACLLLAARAGSKCAFFAGRSRLLHGYAPLNPQPRERLCNGWTWRLSSKSNLSLQTFVVTCH